MAEKHNSLFLDDILHKSFALRLCVSAREMSFSRYMGNDMAWHQGEEPLWLRLQPDSVCAPGLSFESVWRRLISAAAQGPVFSKDFPHYVEHLRDDEFLAHFKHSFLIRDPAKTITSIYRHWPDFHPVEAGFVEQRRLFDRLCDQFSEVPPVMDSDDLLEDPQSMVAAYCDAVGIPFLPEALSSQPGARTLGGVQPPLPG